MGTIELTYEVLEYLSIDRVAEDRLVSVEGPEREGGEEGRGERRHPLSSRWLP